MMRCLFAVLSLWMATACATAPMPGTPIGEASACLGDPLSFAAAEGRALHVCPYGREARLTEFAVVEQGVVREMMDESSARRWVASLRCARPGRDAASSVDDPCVALVADLFQVWRTAEQANARAVAAERSLVRTRMQAKTWRERDPFLGSMLDW